MTDLPSLPKRHKTREADFGIQFRKWWTAHPLWGEFELKDTRGRDYLPFSEFTADQEAVATMAMGRKGVLVRRSLGTTGGADYSGLVGVPCWVVIKYKKAFHIISVNTFLLEKSRSRRRSLTEDRASAIATISVPLRGPR